MGTLAMPTDYEIKLNKRAMAYSNSYMSNSKWIKFFQLFLDKEVALRYKTLWDNENYEYSLEAVSEVTLDFIGEKYIKDGVLLSGPLVYKEIVHIDIYKFEKLQVQTDNSVPTKNASLDLFKESLDKVGQFRVVEFGDFVRILGYS